MVVESWLLKFIMIYLNIVINNKGNFSVCSSLIIDIDIGLLIILEVSILRVMMVLFNSRFCLVLI